MAPQVFTMIVKEVKLMALTRGVKLHQYLDGWLIRAQSQKEAQVNIQTVVDLTQSLGWIINQEKAELKPTQVFLFMGYEYHLDSALVKPTLERWLKLQDLILPLKSKHVLTARCLMSLIGLLASMEKMVLEGCLHMMPFQFHLKEHRKFPQSLDSLLSWTETISGHLEWWQNPTNMIKGVDLHPKDHSIQLFTDASNKGWDADLEQASTKGLWSEREKRLHINVLELKAVSLAVQKFTDQCENQTVLVVTDNSTVVVYINKQGGTHSEEMCALLWKIMTWCHHYQITLKADTSLVNRMVTASAGVQTDLSQVVHSSCRSICHSSGPQSSTVRISSPRPKCLVHRCSEYKWVRSHCLCVPSHGSPSQGDPKNQAIQLPDHCNGPRLARDALVLGPSAALNRDSSVKNSPQTVSQLCVSQQSTTSQSPHLVSRSGPSEIINKDHLQVKVGPIWEMVQRKFGGFSIPSVKKVSDFIMHLYQDLNRRPLTIDGYKMAIVDTLGPTRLHISQSSDLNWLLSRFHRDRPKSSRNLPKWNLYVVLNEFTKAPFEPMKDTDLKQLTLKTAFLLAFASSKHCSKIHAWAANKVLNLGQWEKVALFPSWDFIAKNQLAREGSQSVSLVTIPALL